VRCGAVNCLHRGSCYATPDVNVQRLYFSGIGVSRNAPTCASYG
jgi:hypothetical protein